MSEAGSFDSSLTLNSMIPGGEILSPLPTALSSFRRQKVILPFSI
jgi:hypothetical protein